MTVGTLTAMGAEATMDDEDGWASEDGTFASMLNHNFPAGSGGGDGAHHTPYGVPAGLAAAAALGGNWAATTVNAELPEGAVS